MDPINNAGSVELRQKNHEPAINKICLSNLIDEEDVIIKAFGNIKASENAAQMLCTFD